MRGRKSRIMRKDFLYGSPVMPYVMLLPAMVFLGLFTVWPLINLVQMSLYRGNAVNPYKEFVGLKNFITLLTVKEDFRTAIVNTLVYAAGLVTLTIAFALLAAVWLSKDKKINNFCQTLFFTPHLVSMLSCAFIWKWMYASNDYGLFNSVLRFFGFSNIRWLDSSITAMPSVIILNVWKGFGYHSLIIMTALKAIPREIYEAAEIDNSGPVSTFFRITVPLLSPQLFMLLVTITTGAFKVFDSVRIMTGGGPGRSTQMMTNYIYDTAFLTPNSLGLGSAAGVILSVILSIITIIYFRMLERKVHY